MRANLRVLAVLLAGAAWLTPAVALAQAVPPQTTTNTPATDSVGPAGLQDFSLKGTVTRPADQPPPAAPARPQTAPVRTPVETASPSSSLAPRRAERPALATPTPAPSSAARQVVTTTPAPAPQPVAQAPVQSVPLQAAPPPAQLASPEPAPPSGDPFALFRGLPLWPWIAAALALAAGGAFLLWRRWPRELAAAGSQFDLLVPAPPEPEPRPQPRPEPLQRAPAPAPRPEPPTPAPRPEVPAGMVTTRLRPAAPSGIVASRLRPALELGFRPLRCRVNDEHVTLEFELELFNAGAAPARAVIAGASLLNAGATREDELAAFFANPNVVGERVEMIPPMKRVSFVREVIAPRGAVEEYELAGRKSFVPVIAFNALYEWSGGKAQSSTAYLVGRETQKDKLGPLRLDQGAREYVGLGARPLPVAVRT
ncbi:MAG: hypothetical protein V4499_06085 [Pseudomonadota bacterium]